MKKFISFFILFWVTAAILFSQSASKLEDRATRAFKKAEYSDACKNAIEALKLNPKKKKAQEILSNSYDLAMESLQDSIELKKKNSLVFTGDGTVYIRRSICENYESIIEIDQGAYEVSKIVKGGKFPLDFSRVNVEDGMKEAHDSLISSEKMAAESHYLRAVELMELSGVENNKKATLEFRRVRSFLPNYKDSDELCITAKENGTTRIGVLPFANVSGQQSYGALGETFRDRLITELSNKLKGDEFIEVVSHNQIEGLVNENTGNYSGPNNGQAPTGSTNLNYHIIISGKINQVVISNKGVSNDGTENVSGNVVVGYENYVNDKGKTKKREVYGTAYAQVTTYSKVINTMIVGSYTVTRTDTRKELLSQEYKAVYDWSQCWIKYSGDKRVVDFNGCGSEEQAAPVGPVLVNKAIDNAVIQISPEIESKVHIY